MAAQSVAEIENTFRESMRLYTHGILELLAYLDRSGLSLTERERIMEVSQRECTAMGGRSAEEAMRARNKYMRRATMNERNTGRNKKK